MNAPNISEDEIVKVSDNIQTPVISHEAIGNLIHRNQDTPIISNETIVGNK